MKNTYVEQAAGGANISFEKPSQHNPSQGRSVKIINVNNGEPFMEKLTC